MTNPPTPQPPPTSRPPRTRNQLTIFLTGASLLLFSSLLTRRALTLRRQSILPRFYHPSNQQPSLSINGRVEAWQALGIATVNVASFFVMMGGGLLWAFDIAGVEELRGRVGGGGGRGVDGRWRGRGREKGEEEEEEFEKWVASMAGKKVGEKKVEERRWSARESREEEGEGEERYAVVEPRATSEREKPR